MMIDQRSTGRAGAVTASVVAALVVLAATITPPVFAADVIAEWNSVKAPATPELKKVTASTKDTALIVMDMQTNSCNAERRPRCLETVAPVADLLKRARDKGMLVIHTITTSGTREMLLKELTPQASETHVQATVDKFFKTNLEEQLKAKNITNVILVGTAAEGAVLGTATGAAQRGMKVIVPVDGMSSADPYLEQSTAVYLVKSPGTAAAATLTRAAMIDIN